MKIAILTVELNTHSGSRAPIELGRALAKLNHQVTIISYKKNAQPVLLKQLTKENIRCEFVRSGGLKSIFEVANKLKKKAYDVISFHADLSFFLGAKLSKLPIVRTYYGTQLDAIIDKFFPNTNMFINIGNWLGNIYTQTVEQYILSHSNIIVAISKYSQAEVKKLYQLTADFCYLGTPSYLTLTNKEPTRDKKKTITILSVSRLVPYKGFHLLIPQVLGLREKYPQLRLLIAGRQTNKRYFEYLKSLSQDHISIFADVSDRQLVNLYRTADIYVSCDRFLFFGLPILEASALSLPTVALNYCAAAEVIQHRKTGYIADSMTEFAKYLTRLIDSASLRSTMGRRARNFAATFTWQKTARTYEKKFQKLI